MPISKHEIVVYGNKCVPHSIVASMAACHVADPGSIPGEGVYYSILSFVNEFIVHYTLIKQSQTYSVDQKTIIVKYNIQNNYEKTIYIIIIFDVNKKH